MTTKPSRPYTRGSNPGIESSDGAPGFGEPLSKLDFELRDLMRCRCHPGQDVAWQQTHSELVRVMNNDRVIDRQAKRGSHGHARGHRTRKL